ncbi:MAG: hypothetical protein RAO94_12980 [Candidatus Stygibacter australis]|nr:hypothetical protein [Candidatus Stygibacter australis]MDP8323255.1 hypothetical protein [Candidatus Stygibacter australis]
MSGNLVNYIEVQKSVVHENMERLKKSNPSFNSYNQKEFELLVVSIMACHELKCDKTEEQNQKIRENLHLIKMYEKGDVYIVSIPVDFVDKLRKLE